MKDTHVVCLLTSGQPSTNPRLLKEADALAEAGYRVHVVAAHWASWADETDRLLLPSRAWSCSYVGGSSTQNRLEYWWTRIRQGLARRGVAKGLRSSFLQQWSLCRVGQELARAAKSVPADLYIAHTLGALPAAITAGTHRVARVGFDAEDFYSGMRQSGTDQTIVSVERSMLPRCDFVTTASPPMADAYAALYDIPRPTPILNVFPIADRPTARPTSPADGPLQLYWFSQTIGRSRGLEDVVAAMGLLESHRPELHLRGSWQPGYADQLYALAGSLGVRKSQIIAHEPASPCEMVRLASQYDVGLALEAPFSANADITISNKIFTYLLAGNAVAATFTTGQREVVRQLGKAAISYKPGDVIALAGGLRRWSEDRTALNAARLRSWELASQRYNWDLEKRAILTVVSNCLSRRPERLPGSAAAR